MNKLILFGIVALTSLNVEAQNVLFVDTEHNPLPDTVVLSATLDEVNEVGVGYHVLAPEGYIEDIDETAPTVAVRRQVINYVDDSAYIDKWDNGNYDWAYPTDQLCWGQCFFYGIDDTEITSGYFQIGVDDVAPNPSDLHNVIHYKSYGVVGTTIIKYSIITESMILDELVIKFEITDEVGVPEKSQANNVSIYPNPFSKHLTINNLENVRTVVMSNILGQVVYKTELFDQKINLNTDNLNNGVYFVTTVNTDNTVGTKRIIKE